MGNSGDYLINGCTLAIDVGWTNTDLQGNRKGLYSELFFIFFIHFILQVLHTFRYKPRGATYSPPPPIQQQQPSQIKQENQIKQMVIERQLVRDQVRQGENQQKIQEIVPDPDVTERRVSIAKTEDKQNTKQPVKQTARESVPIQQEGDPRPQLPWHDKRWSRNFSVIFSTHCIALGMVILFSPLAGALVVAYMHLICFIVYTFCEARKMLFPVKVVRTVMDLLNLVLIIIGTVGINYNQSNDAGCLVNQ